MAAQKSPTNRLIHIGLGANLGQAEASIKAALAQLSSWAYQNNAEAAFKTSRLYRSASIGAPGPNYINAVAEMHSPLDAQIILTELQSIETAFGRTRPFPNAPRTLDLDLLLVGSQSIHLPHLIVPHPRMSERAFVLKPLAELRPQLTIAGRSIQYHLQQCQAQDCEPVLDHA
jgi:2-amino-4-hydroxy-6-hydroxymethyldihydropteridine diphosphokinase